MDFGRKFFLFLCALTPLCRHSPKGILFRRFHSTKKPRRTRSDAVWFCYSLFRNQTYHGNILIAAQQVQQGFRNLLFGLNDRIRIVAAGTAADVLDVCAVCG